MDAKTTRATLLERLRDRHDQAAWREFYERYGELIRSFARRQGLQGADLDDVLQDVLTSLTPGLERFRYDPARGKFRSYLKTVTVHAVSRLRCQDRRSRALEGVEEAVARTVDDSGVDDVWEENWRLYHIRRALRRLEPEFNPRDRAVFADYAVAGHGAQETARAHGVSVEQVWQAKSRILRRLTEIISEQVRDEG